MDYYPVPNDDFESLLYATIYLITGELPWHRTKSNTIALKSK
jgi:hypothetical protein